MSGNKRQRGLTPAQERAVELLAQGQGMGEVATAVGVHRVTLWEWTRLPAFAEACEVLRQEAWRAAADRMRRNVTRAAEVIGAALDDPSASLRDRLLAAKLALDATAAVEDRVPDTSRLETWEAIVQGTAESAANLLLESGALEISNARTPGEAWALAGLSRESFARVDRLRHEPIRASAYCERLLSQLKRGLDARAFDGTAESRAS
jgi:hypothetical protein